MSSVASRSAHVVDRVEAWTLHTAQSRVPLVTCALVTAVGLGLLVAATVPVGEEWFGPVGTVTVGTTLAAALAARTGGRPVIFGALALALGLAAVLSGNDILRTGAAVLTSAAAAVLGVMSTVPARTIVQATRECLIALAIAAIGALATVGFEPTVRVARFEYAALALALVGALVVVYRLGAGLHGMGRRGLVVVVVGVVVLSLILFYAELLRRYDSTGVVETLLDVVRWSRENLGAFPRPLEAVLGIPALAYGCHMRARRRQGWWVCAFGVAATSSVTTALVNPRVELAEIGLSVLYGLLVGLVIAWVLIRLDLALTGSRGRGRRSAELAAAVRPEPPRTAPLL
ncbi:MAG TPA: hypothetical protein VD859_15025 [Nocardioides sp.]|nr:hypothetical protein [Nocardioides sp.]